MKALNKTSHLTASQEAFCVKFVATGNKFVAYKEGFPKGGEMKDSNIHRAASRLLQLPKIVARINQLRDKVAERAGIDAAAVIKRLGEIAFADANELTSYRRYNCRHCNGRDHRYQWTDENEYAMACAQVIDYNALGPKKKRTMPNDEGGYGYRKHSDPVPDCPMCHGDGVEVLHIADTRKLSADGKALYAGTKKTKEGIEVKMQDQAVALKLLAQHFGVIGAENVTNVNVNASVTTIPDMVVPMSAAEASKFYQDIMQGKKK